LPERASYFQDSQRTKLQFEKSFFAFLQRRFDVCAVDLGDAIKGMNCRIAHKKNDYKV
jgi:hypothetical protein